LPFTVAFPLTVTVAPDTADAGTDTDSFGVLFTAA
jgi:hypothetical protein